MLQSLSWRALNIAFKQTFAHASASRDATHTLWVEARSRDGLLGYGEGCPREYVSHETLAGAAAFVESQREGLIATIRDLDTLRSRVERHGPEIDANPAAWCAIELALLDLLARRNGQTVEALLELPRLSGRFRYTAVIGDVSPQRFHAQLARYLTAGFRDYKIKLSGNAALDRAKVAALKAAGIEGAAVRADANNLWTSADRAIDFLSGLDFPFVALEEPLKAGDFPGMRRIAATFDCAIILDESLLRDRQLNALGDSAVRWLVNLRVSKMGGLLRSLRLAHRIRQAGLKMIVGAHVGETSLLTRAALAVANSARDILYAQEGAFGTHLLERDVVHSPIMFGAGGVLEAQAVPTGFGFALRYTAL
ncbi:MAG TPA: enolase C-terminal domain-like protein [Burkholderiales bacterium]|jgi:L-alanine-DL-glutamate epimerase-like enolase superfamily enzyme|nr:enolase C-terminal domain-like protein [Burkholderiales bacterium]